LLQRSDRHYIALHNVTSYYIMWSNTGIFDDLDKTVDRAVTRVLTTYVKWYMLLRRNEHTENTLDELEGTGRLLLLSLKVYLPVSGPLSQCTKIKFHMILHYPESIRRFGSSNNFVAESFEMAHKPSKAAARRTNWKAHHIL
jgi:hypothetical protein